MEGHLKSLEDEHNHKSVKSEAILGKMDARIEVLQGKIDQLTELQNSTESKMEAMQRDLQLILANLSTKKNEW